MIPGLNALAPVLRRFWLWTVALAALSGLYSMVLTRALHLPHPYGLNLVWGSDRWWDFLIFRTRFLLFRTPGFWTVRTYPFTYPAPTAVLFGLMYKLRHPLADYLAFCVSMLLLWTVWLARALRAQGVGRGVASAFAVTLVATAFPVWFLLVTANIEGFVALLLTLGVGALLRGRCLWGAALIGLAGSMKIFPLILLGLLVSRRRYREAAFGLLVAAAATLASLALLGPSVAEANRHIAAGIAFVKMAFVFSLSPRDTVFNHSLFVPLKLLLGRIQQSLHPAQWNSSSYLEEPLRNARLLERPYEIYVGCAVVLGLLLFITRIRHLPRLNQVIALTVCAVLLPPLSLDYTLLNLLFPLGLLCLYANDRARMGLNTGPLPRLFTCFAVIFTSGTFFNVHFRMAALVRTLALCVLLFESLREALPWTRLEGPVPDAAERRR